MQIRGLTYQEALHQCRLRPHKAARIVIEVGGSRGDRRQGGERQQGRWEAGEVGGPRQSDRVARQAAAGKSLLRRMGAIHFYSDAVNTMSFRFSSGGTEGGTSFPLGGFPYTSPPNPAPFPSLPSPRLQCLEKAHEDATAKGLHDASLVVGE